MTSVLSLSLHLSFALQVAAVDDSGVGESCHHPSSHGGHSSHTVAAPLK